MKALSFQIPKPEYESYRVQVDKVPYFYDLFHYHPEFQITLIIKGHGTCIIGDYINTFKEGDLFVIGQNLPHVFNSDKSFYNEESEGCHSTSIFLSPTFVSNPFFDLDETKGLKQIFENSKRGMRYTTEDSSILEKRFLKVKPNNTLEGVIHVIELLHELNSTTDLEYLSHIDYKSISNETDGLILNKVFQYTLNNFQEEIPLDKVSEMAHMSAAAFCRFFKKRTRKTYISFLNEVRIQEACRLLLKPDLNVSQICFDCGFNNISNFNRQFKKITGFTPKAYRMQQDI
jgi:AraC-like DNA-binding protein